MGTSGVASTVRRTPFADGTGVVTGFADATGGFLPMATTMNAAGILDRLGRIAARPLASVEFRYPEPDPYAEVGLERPPADAPQRPIGVHIEQLAPGEIVPSFEEDLRLVRNADCWWVSF